MRPWTRDRQGDVLRGDGDVVPSVSVGRPL